jgi:hypothetical protein
VVQGVGGGGEPERNVDTVLDESRVGTLGSSSLEVMNGIEGDAKAVDAGGQMWSQWSTLPPTPWKRMRAGWGLVVVDS